MEDQEQPSPPPLPPDPLLDPQGSIGRGMAFGCLLHLCLIPMMFIVGFIGSAVAPRGYGALAGLAVGFWAPAAQLIYLLPAAIRFKNRGESESVKGIIVVGVFTTLACIPCWTMLLK
jgi:hypothetical protein